MVAEAGIAAVRRKAAALTALAVDLADERLAALGFTLGTPRDPAARGAHVSLRHPDAWRVCRALIEHANVVPDFRRPDSIRLGLPPLYTRFADVWDAVDRLAALVADGVHERMPAETSRVT
jgi:kynureninase